MICVREFHNTVKKMCYIKAKSLLGKTPNNSLLDIAGGRGGDISKYSTIQCEHVIVLDIDKKGLEECMRRFSSWKREYPKSIKTIHGDMTLPAFGKNFTETFSIIACHFAIHYSFSSERDADTCIKNISDCLCIGGIFMVTMLDGDTLYDAVIKDLVRKDILNFDHTTISLPHRTITDFGYPVDITIRSISEFPKREYLVKFGVLKQKAFEYGLDVVDTGMFSSIKNNLSGIDLDYSSLHRWVLFMKL